MRPKVITQTGTGTSTPVIVNWRQNQGKISINTEVTGTVTYTVQHTLDDPWAKLDTINNTPVYSDAEAFNTDANWQDIDLADLVAATTGQDGNYFFPVRAIRLNVTAGSGTVQATILQGNVT